MAWHLNFEPYDQVTLNYRGSSSTRDSLSGLGMTPSKKVSKGNTYSNIVTCDTDATTHDTLTSRTMTFTNSDAYRQPHDVIQTRKLPDVPRIPVDSAGYLSDTNTSTYAVPDTNRLSTLYSSNRSSMLGYPPPPQRIICPSFKPSEHVHSMTLGPLQRRTQYGSRDVYNLHGILAGDGIVGQSFIPPNHVLPMEAAIETEKICPPVTEFPRHCLTFVEKLGEGLFGEVHLCEAVGIKQALGDELSMERFDDRPVLVAVKIMSANPSAKAREEFHKEVKVMSRLKDPNIVSLLGVCTRDEPLCVVLEYMKYGDLNQFLLTCVPSESSLVVDNDVKTLSYGCLIYMATQIASGMKFLETLNLVHRDLATRNCLVGSQFTIKISDFGMSRNLYSADYYRIEGKAVLPIRWMAWESVLLGKFSTKSDVWSFAITMWEILTFARVQPFDNLSDDQVIENCSHYYHGNRQQQVCLPPPLNCPKEIYDLLVECWNHDEAKRPTFREIHMFLQRKNMGYSAMDDRQTTLNCTMLAGSSVIL